MQHRSGRLLYSSQDLIQFVNSEFACWMDRYSLEYPKQCPEKEAPDEMLQSLVQLGNEHEQRFLKGLQDQGEDVCQIENRGAFDTTKAAMQAGRAYIYQAALEAEDFLGYADFLVRVEDPSDLGDWSYVPLECKLALNPKPDFILQSCCYVDLLEQIQGRRPEEFRLLLGDDRRPTVGHRTQQSFPTEKYIYYFYQVRQDFLRMMTDFAPQHRPIPVVGNHGSWQTLADQILHESDHLCQVANITGNQIRRLEAAGITTMQQLAEADPQVHIPKLDRVVVQRLTTQAQLQKQSLIDSQVSFRLTPPDPSNPRKGLALLPPSSHLDVYFDMEGYPLVKGGLEYLFGAVFDQDGALDFKDWWAHDAAMEQSAFEGFIDWTYQRWQDDPTMHVYHYAPYEVTAIKRLMQRYATREAEVDDLLRAGVFVDLYQIVRQGLLVGTTSYSIKYLEPLYGRKRDESVKTAADSVVQYFQWLQIQDGSTPETSQILKNIRDYNQADCESTYELTDWLRQLQQESAIAYQPKDNESEQVELATDLDDPLAQLAERLLEEASAIADPTEAQVQTLLAHLLQFHRREAKPFWWQRFTWLQADAADLMDEPDCIAGLTRTQNPSYRLTPRKRSWTYDYQFDPNQDLRLKSGRECWFVPEQAQKSCTLELLDIEKGLASISISDKRLAEIRQESPDWEPPQQTSLIDVSFVRTTALAQSIFETVEQWQSSGSLPPALEDLIYRRPPRIRHQASPEAISDGQDLLSGCIQAIANLDQSLLCIQGPPGSGKTYTAARVIAHLVSEGKTIAISANSHQAIANLMLRVAQTCLDEDIPLKGLKYGGEKDERLLNMGLTWKSSMRGVDLSEYAIFGATSFQLCKAELAGQWDYLFVDEAGQMSLANMVAIARCASNLVLMGDQMQLEQPIQATHPGESGQSALGYYLNGQATISPEQGIFLNTSYRMHPTICRFISEAIYENRLQHHDLTQSHSLNLSASEMINQRHGICFVPVEHEGNSQHSPEEIGCIERLIDDLMGQPFISERGERQGIIEAHDILVIAPYNLQVSHLKTAIGDRARVGTVDKFQGQEAPVLILSMCASSSEFVPRGLDFLLNPNRLNVAISRAQCLSIVVGSPALASTYCQTVPDIELVNTYCKLIR